MKAAGLILLSFWSYSPVFSQCEIEITRVDFDSISVSLGARIFEGCISYKATRKNELVIYADNEKGAVFEIIRTNETNEYTELDVLNQYGVLVRYLFFKNMNRLDTIIESNHTHIVETGKGLSYKIARRIKGSGRNYS